MYLTLPAWSQRGPAWRRLLQGIEAVVALASGDERSVAEESTDSWTADLDAFEVFFHRYERDIFSYLWRMTGDEQSARDLAQETFLRAWQQFDKIHAYDRPRSWLFRVATHLALNHLRVRRVANRLFASLHPNEVAVSNDNTNHVAEQDVIRRTLFALSPRERAALLLHEVFGLSCAELAVTLGISFSAAKVALWRAREHFRVVYEKEERIDAADAE